MIGSFRRRTSDLFGLESSPAVPCQRVVVAFQPLLGSFPVRKAVFRIFGCNMGLVPYCSVILGGMLQCDR